jgi:hypothetical protein
MRPLALALTLCATGCLEYGRYLRKPVRGPLALDFFDERDHRFVLTGETIEHFDSVTGSHIEVETVVLPDHSLRIAVRGRIVDTRPNAFDMFSRGPAAFRVELPRQATLDQVVEIRRGFRTDRWRLRSMGLGFEATPVGESHFTRFKAPRWERGPRAVYYEVSSQRGREPVEPLVVEELEQLATSCARDGVRPGYYKAAGVFVDEKRRGFRIEPAAGRWKPGGPDWVARPVGLCATNPALDERVAELHDRYLQTAWIGWHPLDATGPGPPLDVDAIRELVRGAGGN